jgi:CubicO group peptidase (beta-lactamase class C family)
MSRKTTSILVLAMAMATTAQASEARDPAIENMLRRTVPIAGAENQRLKLADRMAHYRVPGVSIAVIENCRIVDARGFGFKSWGGEPVSTDTLFQAGSISKSVTAIGALRLVEKGVLGLDKDVRHYAKSWQYDSAHGIVTLRQFLGHTAGTTVAGMKGYEPSAQLPTLTQILAGQAPANTPAITVEGQPGSRWRYSGGGYVVVQSAMSETSGKEFAPLMRELVLSPLGMHASGFEQPFPEDRAKEAAKGIASDGSHLPGGWRVYPEQGAAGLWTTPSDLARFAIGLAHSARGEGNGILGKEATTQLIARGPGNWGLGIDLGPADGPRQISHTGKTIGYTSMFVIYPDRCQGAVVMTNGYDGGWLINEIMRSIGDVYRWPSRKEEPAQAIVPLTDEIADRFIGTYRLKDFPTERFTISRDPAGTLYWARDGHVGRTLMPVNDAKLFSPDSVMTIEVVNPAESRSATVVLGFGGGTNIAERTN